VTARGLGPQGRGVTVSLQTIAQLSGFFFATGAAQSLSYFIGRRPEDAPRLLSTWLLMLLPLTAIAIVVTELLLSTIFAVHAPGAIESGRWFLFTIVLVVGFELNSGVLLGEHDFLVFNLLRFMQPALVALGVTVVWRLGDLTVTSALLIATVASVIVLALGMARSARRTGWGRPDLALGRTTLWYGIRGHGVMVATNVNARLDVALLPAFVAAASVGIYSVATNVSLIIYQVANTFAALLIPAAARDTERAQTRIVGSLFGTLAIAGFLAAGLAVFARPMLEVVYGRQFGSAASTLRLLLPGAVLFAGSSILTAGIYALGKPFTATSAQVAGMAVTVIGLLVFLRIGGITAAALVSTASYATVFIATAIAYKRAANVPWRVFVPTPARILSLR
jgi:O-antigen/teichoic acid export membrane protein